MNLVAGDKIRYHFVHFPPETATFLYKDKNMYVFAWDRDNIELRLNEGGILIRDRVEVLRKKCPMEVNHGS